MADMTNILATIAKERRLQVARERQTVSLAEIARRARALAASELKRDGIFTFPFERALQAEGMSFICEVKKASPSKGLIAKDYDYLRCAREYEAAGAAAISCLTEPVWFLGSDEHLSSIAQEVSIPVMRKDFVVDEYMIYQAKVLGAQAVLIIVAIVNDDELARYIALAHELGLSCLVEAYSDSEVPRALAAGARVVGVNNRDLRNFDVNFGHSIDLRRSVGDACLFVSESGVNSAADVARLAEAKVDAVLIGEALMRAHDKRAMLDELRSCL